MRAPDPPDWVWSWAAMPDGPGLQVYWCRHCSGPPVRELPFQDYQHTEGCLVPLAQAAEEVRRA